MNCELLQSGPIRGESKPGASRGAADNMLYVLSKLLT